MKKWIILFGIMIIIPLAYGVHIRNSSFRQNVDMHNIKSEYEVSYIWGNGGENQQYLDNLSQSLSDMDIIAKVKATGKNNVIFNGIEQEAVVENIYKGEKYIECNDKINIISNYVSFVEDGMLIAGTFVNFMVEDDEYIVFINSTEKRTGVKSDNYVLNETTPIYLNVEDKDNYVPSAPILSVPYEKVKNNEFFVRDEASLKLLMQWKKNLIEEAGGGN